MRLGLSRQADCPCKNAACCLRVLQLLRAAPVLPTMCAVTYAQAGARSAACQWGITNALNSHMHKQLTHARNVFKHGKELAADATLPALPALLLTNHQGAAHVKLHATSAS